MTHSKLLLLVIVSAELAAGCATLNTRVSGNPGDCMRSAYASYTTVRKTVEEGVAAGKPTRASPHVIAAAFREGARSACAILSVGIDLANSEIAAGRLDPQQAHAAVSAWLPVACLSAVRAAANDGVAFSDIKAAADWMYAGASKFVPKSASEMRDQASGWAAVRREAKFAASALPLNDYLATVRKINLEFHQAR